MRTPIRAQVSTSHSAFLALVSTLKEHPDINIIDRGGERVAQVLLDYPTTWALQQLDSLGSVERARTVVVTQTLNRSYLDCLASFHISGVVGVQDSNALLSAVYAAASSQRSYYWKSGLTYMELRVLRLLVLGADTKTAANDLAISYKTVNAHVSNVLSKLRLSNRAQLVAYLLGVGDRYTR